MGTRGRAGQHHCSIVLGRWEAFAGDKAEKVVE